MCDRCAEAQKTIERFRALVEKLADELAEELEGHYSGIKGHPVMRRRYDRDMETVYEARRALLGKLTHDRD